MERTYRVDILLGHLVGILNIQVIVLYYNLKKNNKVVNIKRIKRLKIFKLDYYKVQVMVHYKIFHDGLSKARIFI